MARIIVPDTCVLGAAFYNEAYSSNADPLLEAIRLRAIDAIAPILGIAEFFNVSRKKQAEFDRNPSSPNPNVDAVVNDFLALPIVWWEMDADMAKNAWITHRTHQIETWDAFFIEVAKLFEAELWTTEQAFYRKAVAVYPNSFDLSTRVFI